MWEAPVIRQRTSVGLDVHARSVLGCALDGDTGEVFQRRLCPDHEEIVAWLGDLPGPVAVTYEAGPTGFGLARALAAAGITCEVAAPSKLIRPTGDRVKTDARDAAHLARLLHLGQITAVTIPSASQEAARDLVRAREDCRGDLMTARHRVSKLLLRQGIVYSGGTTWNRDHERWFTRTAIRQPGTTTDLRGGLRRDAGLSGPAHPTRRRDHRDGRRQRVHAGGARVGLHSWDRDVDGVRVGRRGRRLAPVDWTQHRRLRRVGALRVLLGRLPQPGRGDQDRQRTRSPTAGRSRLASPQPLPAQRAVTGPLGSGLSGCPGTRSGRKSASARPLAVVRRPQETFGGRQRGDRPGTGRLVLVTGGHARLTHPRSSR